MPVRFTGGPLDGREFDHGQVAAIADVIPLPTPSGVRAFVAMPSPAACDRVLRGEGARGHQGDTAVYEQVFLPGGGFEFRHATDEEFGEAVEGGGEGESPDGHERRRGFGELADRLSGRLRGAAIGSATGVYLVYRYEDRQGNEYPLRVPVVPWARVRRAGRVQPARVYEPDVHRDAIIGTVYALVRAAPTGWVTLPARPDREVRIAGFDLDIVPEG